MSQDVLRQTEDWFAREGAPSLTAGHDRTVRLVCRMAPFLHTVGFGGLTLAFLISSVSLGHVVQAAAVAVSGAVTFSLVARMRSLPRPPVHPVAPLAAFVALLAGTPWVVWLRAGIEDVVWLYLSEQAVDEYLVRYPPAGWEIEWFEVLWILAIATTKMIVVAVAIVLVAALVARLNLVAVARRVARDAATDLRRGLDASGRAIPVLLVAILFLFFTAEIWQLADRLSWSRLGWAVALFAVAPTVATAQQSRERIRSLRAEPRPTDVIEQWRDTPLDGVQVPLYAVLAPPRLRRLERANLVLLLIARQTLPVVLVGCLLFAFFVLLGIVVVDGATAADWIGRAPEPLVQPRPDDLGTGWIRDWLAAVPAALVRGSALLAGFGAMSFAVSVLADPDSRTRHLGPALAQHDRLLAVRAGYLAYLAHPAAPAEPPKPAEQPAPAGYAENPVAGPVAGG